jgi:hypothetical protein
MTENAAGAANWGKASRQWSLVGSPLRPDASDVAFAEAAIAERFRATGRPPRAVLLGVTPELAACRWPAGTRLTAVDNSRAMIDALWPAPGVPDGAQVLCADWRAMPIADGSIDVVVGDGCYTAAAQRSAARCGASCIKTGAGWRNSGMRSPRAGSATSMP